MGLKAMKHPMARPQAIQRMTRSTVLTTIAMCAGLGATYMVLPDNSPTAIFLTAAVGVMLTLGAGLFLETRGDVRALIRTDVIMLIALYGLTLVEFFFPQELVEEQLDPQTATQGVEALLLGFAGILIGRNFVAHSQNTAAVTGSVHLSRTTVFILFVTAFCVGYLYMLVAVDFNPAELVRQMLAPRFSQPWSRGSLGGLNDLLGTIGDLFLYFVPVLAGCILADWRRYSLFQLAAAGFGLAFTLFYGFTGGTRNVFAVYLVLFVGAYIIFSPKLGWKRTILLLLVMGGVLFLSAYYMLQFRTVGLEDYISGDSNVRGYRKDTLFIDNNLPVIGMLTDIFPDRIPYLGSEMAVWATVHPVPRVLWPGKPEKLSVEAADALGVQGASVASTFIGESYMMAGYPGVIGVAILFGWLAGWWDRFGHDLRSNINVAMYASGFFAAMLSMRSMIWTTTAMLPTVAFWFYLKSRGAMVRRPRIAPPMPPIPPMSRPRL
jgi:oligosaccharide repeat unit polymerase